MAQISQVAPVQLSEVWNPGQSMQTAVQMYQMQEQQRHHAAVEARQLQQEQRDTFLKGAEMQLKNPYLGMTQRIDLYNGVARAMNLPITIKPEDIAGKALRMDDILTAYNETKDFHDDKVAKPFRTLMAEDPELAESIKKRIGTQQLLAKSIPGATDEMAAAVENVPGAITHATQGAVEGKLTEAKVLELRAKAGLEQQTIDNRRGEASLNNSRMNLINLNVQEAQRQGQITNFKLKGLERQSDFQKAFDAEVPAMRDAAVKDITKFGNDITELQRTLTTVTDPEKRQQLQADLAFKTLLRDRSMAESRYLQSQTPENYKLLQQSEDVVNKTLERQSLALGQKTAAIDNLAFRQNEAQQKHELTNLTNKGQQLFAQLPTDKQTPQSASRIAAQVSKESKFGASVSTEQIMQGAKLPNTPAVQVNMSQEKEEAKAVGKSFGEQYSGIQSGAVNAQNSLSKLDRLDSLLKGVETGKLAPAVTQIQALGQSLGFDVDKSLGAKQAIESLTNEIALQLRNPSGGAGMPGALSDKDREFLTSMTPGLSKTPEGNRLIIETARKLAQRSQDVAKMARVYRKSHGQFDEGFLDELQTYSDAHPLFEGQQNEAEAASVTANELTKEESARLNELRKKYKR